jgi:crotonobetainyl-CoA:carnitine CoA-transferase CaiB-like acyl-CoA transferase
MTGGSLPLAGVWILDMTQVWAGPKCTQILADLGAEVVKVESPRRTDPSRGTTNLLGLERYPQRDRGARPHNRSGYFNAMNRNKVGGNLDLSKAEGLEQFRTLVRRADVVVDNFSAGVMDRLGLGPDILLDLKPSLVVVSMSGFGSYGPDSRFLAWAETIEAMGGLPALTGYEGGPPMLTFQAASDPVAGVFGAAAIMTALRQTRATGEGVFVDLAQLEVLVSLNATALLDASMNQRSPQRLGNAHPQMAPHGCYPCREPDTWVSIAIRSNEDWDRFRRCLADVPELQGADLDTLDGRLDRRRQLDDLVGGWTSKRSADEVQATLQAAGIPAGRVLNVQDVVDDPHVRSRDLFQTIGHSEVGDYPYYYPVGARFGDRRRFRPSKPAPSFGEDNEQFLGAILGLEAAQIEAFYQAGVSSVEPLEDVLVDAPPVQPSTAAGTVPSQQHDKDPGESQ